LIGSKKFKKNDSIIHHRNRSVWLHGLCTAETGKILNMKWQKIKYILIVIAAWLVALSMLYILYLKVKYLFQI